MTDPHRAITRGRKFDQVRRGAAAIFLRDGYAGASVDDIARAGGVSKATLYTYFTDKSVMFHEVMRASAAELLADSPRPAPVDLPPARHLAPLLRAMLDWLLSPDCLSLHRLAIAEAHRFPDCISDYVRQRDAAVLAPIRAQIDRWIAAGAIAPHDSARSAGNLAAMLAGAPVQQALLGSPPDPERIARLAGDCAWLFRLAHDRDLPAARGVHIPADA